MFDDLLRQHSKKLVDLSENILAQIPKQNSLRQQLSVSQVESLVNRAGFSQYTEGLRPLYNKAASQVSSSLKDVQGFGDITQVSARAVGTIFEDGLYDIKRKVGAQLTSEVKKALDSRTLDGESLRVTSARISDATKKAQGQVHTIVNSGLASLQRELQAQAEEMMRSDDPLRLYVGPEDKVTRPFCSVLVGKAVPSKWLSQLNNNQGLPVARHGGGWNCRHSLLPISREFAEMRDIEIVTLSLIREANSAARRRRVK